MGESNKRSVLLVLFLAVLVAALDIAMVGPALPALRDYYGIDERAVAWVLNVFVLFNFVGVPLMSKMADVYGRRLVFCMDIGLFAMGAIVVATSPPFEVVLAGRALQGFGAAGIFPVSSAVIGDVFPKEQQGRALGLLGSVFGLAFIVGPAASGILLRYGWPWLFVSTLPLAAVAFALGRRYVPAARSTVAARRFDLRGLLLVSTALATLAFGVNGISAIDFGSSLMRPRVWVFVFIAAVFGAAFYVSSRRAVNPIIPPAIFATRQARLAVMLTAATGFCEAVIIFVPSLAEATFGVDKSTASFMFLPLAAAVAVGSPAFGWLLDRFGARTVVMVASVCLSVGLGTVAQLPSLLPFYTGTVLVGFALAGLLGSSLNYILLRESRLQDRVAAQGIVTLSLNTGILMGGAVVGALAASGETHRAGYETAFTTIAVLGVFMFGISLFLRGRKASPVAIPSG